MTNQTPSATQRGRTASIILVFAALIAALQPIAAVAALDEIMVRATRRGETDLMTTPVAVTSLSPVVLEKFPIRSLNDISYLVPGLSGGKVAAFNSAQFSLRGVTETTIIVYKEAPVGVTLDDFVVPHIQTSNLEMFDIETVEVLRGPQGTLFGKNTTAGVINVKTKRPVLDERDVDLRLGLGQYGKQEAKLALNLPIINDTLAVRIAGMYLETDGYYSNSKAFGPLGAGAAPVDPAVDGISNQGDGRDLGGDDVFSGRFKVLWQPTDNFNALFQYEMVRDDGDTPPIVNESPPSYLFPVWGYQGATGDPLDNAGVFFRPDAATIGVDTASGHQVDIDGIYLNWEWGISDKLSIVGNAGYREQESRLANTYTGEVGPVSLFDATRDDDRETTQIEARLVTSFDGPVNFTAGVYYQEDETDFCVLQIVGFLDNFFLGAPSQFFNNNPLILCNAQEADSLAGYIDGTYQLTDRFSVTAGFRLTQEDKSWTGRPRVPLDDLDGVMFNGFPTLADLGEPLGAADFNTYSAGVVRDEEDWSEPTYRLTFGYDFNDDLYGYLGYSRGFKSGGYNDQIGTQLNPIVPAAARPTEPEIADSVEAGIRATLADGSAELGVTGYWVEYSDAQRTLNASFPTGQETLFFNAAELEVFGLELEGRWEVVDNLVITGNAAVTDAEFNEFQADTDFDGMIDVDLSGNPVQRVPDWMFTLDGTYTHDLGGDRGSLALNARLSYEDESIFSYSDVDPQFDTTLQSRVLVDAAVTWNSADDRWWVSAYGKNLTDDRYRTGSLSVATLWVMSSYAPPRWFGVEVGANFDW